jgi:hypothetical protein
MIKRLSLPLAVAAVGVFTASILTAHTFTTLAGWPSGSTVPMYLMLGTAPSTLLDGARSWDEVAASAVSIWDRQLVSIDLISRIQGRTPAENDGFNDLFFADDVFGDAFGATSLATTNIWYRGETRIEGNIVFNRAKTWNSYRGPLRSGVIDFRRVALHALGHTLGLSHPDLAGQNVTSIMNSTAHDAGGTVDDLQADDMAGARALYGSAPQPATPALASTPRADRVAFRRAIETLYRSKGGSTRRTYVDIDGIGIWTAEYYWYRVSYCDHATAIARVFAQIEGRGVQPVCAEPASINLAANLADSDAFRAALETEYRDVLRSSPIDSYLTNDADSIWMKVYVENRFKGMNHAQATTNITDKFAAPAPAPAPAPRPTPAPIPGGARSPEAFCASLPQTGSGNWFFCGTPQGNLQGGLPNGWLGYCQMTQMNLGVVGYSATMFNGGADLVRDYSGAQDTCNMLNLGGLRQCGSVIQCTRQ